MEPLQRRNSEFLKHDPTPDVAESNKNNSRKKTFRFLVENSKRVQMQQASGTKACDTARKDEMRSREVIKEPSKEVKIPI